MSDCLHCEIHEMLESRLQSEQADLAEIAAKVTEVLADLILMAPPGRAARRGGNLPARRERETHPSQGLQEQADAAETIVPGGERTRQRESTTTVRGRCELPPHPR